MADDKASSERFQAMLSARTVAYLKALARKGTHGSSVPAVGRSLIEQGIRQAIVEKFIAAEDGDVSD
ncbi:hypothetical protein [Mesorhizobium sp. B2-4-6]|uniref:hypothetical protein n=1 Tax=Mesorhizobium sp. B2-4-6 TaxID=2589943 RepID=UPI00112A50D9|nr:hypothetical protein [Mesorhizobium sp. B2-4-6]TPL38885.1 hypothetical protein FJ957_28040 [Mesorhizobium sp. B2-4-6]